MYYYFVPKIRCFWLFWKLCPSFWNKHLNVGSPIPSVNRTLQLLNWTALQLPSKPNDVICLVDHGLACECEAREVREPSVSAWPTLATVYTTPDSSGKINTTAVMKGVFVETSCLFIPWHWIQRHKNTKMFYIIWPIKNKSLLNL